MSRSQCVEEPTTPVAHHGRFLAGGELVVVLGVLSGRKDLPVRCVLVNVATSTGVSCAALPAHGASNRSIRLRRGLSAVFPRIHIEFAAVAPVAAILRRGPSKWVHLLAWNTQQDTVIRGAWLRGRIYEHGCGVSPDGSFFACHVAKYTGPKSRCVGYSWTAVSRLPWLTALALWPHSDTWAGGAQFVDNQTLIIDCPWWESLKMKGSCPTGFAVLPRWIGQDAPPQDLPRIPETPGTFDGSCGVDQAGKSFQYVDGQLLRGDRIVIDLNRMSPEPQPSPDYAKHW